MSEFSKYSRARLDDRQVTELIGIARGLIADGVVSGAEVEYLHKWLAASVGTTDNPLINTLFDRLEAILSDGIVDAEEQAEVFEALTALTGSDFEVGEALKSTTLPLCDPAPVVSISGARFTFTGTFTFGSRRECEAAVTERGGTAGTLRRDTTYLVIGEYANDAWVHSSYGRKIEKALKFRDFDELPISIISEKHWRLALGDPAG